MLGVDLPAAPPLELPRLPAAATATEYLRLKRAANRPPEAVAQDQRARLEAMLAHSRRHVPLYRDLYRELPDEAYLELKHLPFIDKQTIRACSHEERSCGPVPPMTRHLFTSGTTGEPASTDWSPGSAWRQGVLTLRMASLQGLAPLHTRAVLVWNPDDRSGVGGVFGRLRQRHLQLSAYQSPAKLARTLQDARPDAVWGQSHLLIELGEWLDPSFRPRVVNTAGQELTSEDRAAIVRIYGSEPLDVYSTSEQGLVAWQCHAADLYHINHEAVIVEALDDHGSPVPPGTSGELVTTGLCNTLMPYLRYRTGDAGVITTRPCQCGSMLPALERIEGRLSDWFLDERARRVAPHRLWLSAHLEGGLDLVHRYQLRQFPSKRVTIRLVPRTEIGEDILRSLEQSYQRLLGATVPIEIQLVERLEEERSHKFRTIMAVSAEATSHVRTPISR
jgi:phenylacetate-CoA ligase